MFSVNTAVFWLLAVTCTAMRVTGSHDGVDEVLQQMFRESKVPSQERERELGGLHAVPTTAMPALTAGPNNSTDPTPVSEYVGSSRVMSAVFLLAAVLLVLFCCGLSICAVGTADAAVKTWEALPLPRNPTPPPSAVELARLPIVAPKIAMYKSNPTPPNTPSSVELARLPMAPKIEMYKLAFPAGTAPLWTASLGDAVAESTGQRQRLPRPFIRMQRFRGSSHTRRPRVRARQPRLMPRLRIDVTPTKEEVPLAVPAPPRPAQPPRRLGALSDSALVVTTTPVTYL